MASLTFYGGAREIGGNKKLGIKTVLVGKPCGEEDYCVTTVSDFRILSFSK